MNAEVVHVLGEVEVADDLMGFTLAGDPVRVEDPTQLESTLSRSIYRTFHAGRVVDEGRSSRHRDPDLEKHLAAAVPHHLTRTRAKLLETYENRHLVELDGLRVLVDKEWQGKGVFDSMELPPIRPSLSPGFLLVDGSKGSVSGMALARLYFHLLSPDSAPVVWEIILRKLESLAVPYRAKVASDTAEYPRRDAAVVYLDKNGWAAARDLVDEVSGSPGMGSDTSLFGFEVAPGISVASEPMTHGARMVSFGQHRSTAAARGLIASVEHPGGLEVSLAQAFVDAGIDPGLPAFNSDERMERTHWSHAWM